MDWKLELVVLPVSDVDRAKAFYTEKIGFNADHDHRVNDKLRFVQLTPPGSGCSIAIGEGIVQGAPGSVHGLQIVVADVHAAHDQLVERGVEVGDVQDLGWGLFIFFKDPDGNSWAISSFRLAQLLERAQTRRSYRPEQLARRRGGENAARAGGADVIGGADQAATSALTSRRWPVLTS